MNDDDDDSGVDSGSVGWGSRRAEPVVWAMVRRMGLCRSRLWLAERPQAGVAATTRRAECLMRGVQGVGGFRALTGASNTCTARAYCSSGLGPPCHVNAV